MFKVQWEETKEGDYDFWLKFSEGKNLGGNYASENFEEIFQLIKDNITKVNTKMR